MKKRSKTYNLVLYAIYAALIFVARMLDQLVSAAALPINFAVITLSVAFACALINPSLKNGIIVGFIFGFSSFITSFIFIKPIIFGMANPLISVFPRIVVGIVVFLVFNLTYSIFVKTKLKNPKFLAIVFACIAGTCTNTLLVISLTWLFQLIAKEVLASILLANWLPELIVPALIVPGIVYGVRRSLRIKDKYNTENTNEKEAQ